MRTVEFKIIDIHGNAKWIRAKNERGFDVKIKKSKHTKSFDEGDIYVMVVEEISHKFPIGIGIGLIFEVVKLI